jgi:hypothetical protein
MKPETTEKADWSQVLESLGAIRAELARLGERVAALEAAAATGPRASGPRRRRLPRQRGLPRPRASAMSSSSCS